MTLSACGCSACQKYGLPTPSSAPTPPASVFGPNVPYLPVPACSVHSGWKADYCNNCQVETIITLSTTSDPAWAVSHALDYSAKFTLTAALRKVVQNATAQGNYTGSAIEDLIRAIYDGKSETHEMLSHDLFCQECQTWVSNVDPSSSDHWDLVCGECGNHEDGDLCVKCPKCEAHESDYANCECCTTCENAPGWCECCEYCGNTQSDCECVECDECGSLGQYCGCGETPYHFGSTKKVDWDDMPELSESLDLGGMGSVDLSIDPVRAAADYYLLDGIVNLVRFSDVDAPEAGMRRLADKREIVHNDDMLSCWVNAATRSRNNLIEQLDRSFLNYAVAAVGGELRYHRACAGDWAPQNRSSAWAAFIGIVNEKGADVVFNAVDLFEEFGSGSYGGTKWAQIAKVTAMRLAGKMAPWLFVDRIFTLEHNGGCVLNKQSWSVDNTLGYGLYHMKRVLNAHAGKCQEGALGCSCETCTKSETGWDLLLRVASPSVAQLFRKTDERISAQARRAGGYLPAIPVKAAKPAKDRSTYCYDCGQYGCSC